MNFESLFLSSFGQLTFYRYFATPNANNTFGATRITNFSNFQGVKSIGRSVQLINLKTGFATKGKTLFKLDNAQAAFKVPAWLFAAGGSYRWRMMLEDKVLEDEFSILSKADQAELNSALADVAASAAGRPQDKLLMEALVFDYKNMEFDRDYAISRLLQSKGN